MTLNKARTFKHLGSRITSDGKYTDDIKNRIRQGKNEKEKELIISHNINENMWKNLIKIYMECDVVWV